jgi:glycosyltransferase involved in cell wall biosynthesis
VKLSVVIPFLDERHLLAEVVRRVLAVRLEGIGEIEVLLVDDGSADGSGAIADRLAAEHPAVRSLHHPSNRGKGAAVRTGIEAATGDFLLVQDADLEYSPEDYPALLRPFFESGADVVYGSRFLTGTYRRVLYFRHTLGNRFLTFASNLFTDLNLTDVETCYKAFRAPLIKSIPLRSDGFGFEVEVTAKVAKRNCRVFEVPVRYAGRTYQEGKKIRWTDGVAALGTILRYWVIDDVFKADEVGAGILKSLERARRFNRWMADRLRPAVGDRVLEIGAGIGNLTTQLLPRDRYLASDVGRVHLDYLESLRVGRPYLEVARIDAEEPSDFAPHAGQFDTVVCVNVLEHLDRPRQALANFWTALEPGGRLVAYVPQGRWLTSSLDRALEHRRRYHRASLEAEVREAGFAVESCRHFNRISVLGWLLNGKLLGRARLPRWQVKLFDLLVPVLRLLDGFLPWPGLGLVLVARKPAATRPSPRAE